MFAWKFHMGPHAHGHGKGGGKGGKQQPAYAQQGNAQQQAAPDSCHEHPLNYVKDLGTNQCKLCHQASKPGYKCDQCPLMLCETCATNIFYNAKAREVHKCPLALRCRNAWKCDVCKNAFKDTVSFYCKACDFDACSKCFVGFKISFYVK